MAILFFLLCAVVLLRSVVYVSALLLIVLALCVIGCWIVKILPGTEEEKAYRYILAVGFAIFAFGLAAAIMTKDVYVGILSGAIVHGGPHPLAIVTAILGAFVFIGGMFFRHLTNKTQR